MSESDDASRAARQPETQEAEGHVLELLHGYALGVLDPDETELVARHVQGCAICRRELRRFERVGQLLPYGVPPRLVPLRARTAVLTAIDAVGTSNDERLVVLAAPPADRRSWLRRHPVTLAVASIAAVVVLMFGVMVAMGERNNQLEEQIAQIEEEKDEAQTVLMKVPTPIYPRFVTEFVTTPAGEDARGKLFIDHDLNSAMVLIVDLPAMADGEHYLVWLQLYGEAEYARAGALEVDEQQRAQLTIEPVDALSSYETIVITIEADPDAAAPAGPQLMTAGMIPQQ